MQQVCKKCGTGFEITDDDLKFYESVSPVFNSETYIIPPPTLCPECRLQRRLAFRNQIFVYTRSSSSTGKIIFSMFTDDAPFPVINNEEWWGDFDATHYQQTFDPQQPFFDQFVSLRNQVPHPARYGSYFENSDYSNNAHYLKNCYLVFNTTDGEDCMYCENVWESKDCIDCSRCPACELCFDCTSCSQCYNVQSSQECSDCSDSLFLMNCRSCRNCLGCVNLRNQQYCVFNEQKTREEYENILASLSLGSYQARAQFAQKCQQFFLQHPRPHVSMLNVEHCTGNYIKEARNVHDSFFLNDTEQCRYCMGLNRQVHDCQDYTLYGNQAELVYESVSCGINLFNLRFCFMCSENCSDLLYCWHCIGCRDCFGCVGLRNKQYHILNQPFSKEAYEETVAIIIQHMQQTGEWGEFFPFSISPIPYNRSLAQRYFSLSKEEIETQNLRWYNKPMVSAGGAIDPEDLPDTVPGSDNHIIAKSATGIPFRITSSEIQRCRQFGVPLPRMTYDERMEERAKKLGGIRLYNRECEKTGKPIVTTIEPESPWIVWDREEYEKEFSS